MVLNRQHSPHWVLLRGLTREAAHWGEFPEMLQNVLPQARVHLLDLPGNGVRHTERSPATVTGMVSDLRAELEHLNIGSPVHVLALSLGAMVSIEWARTAPGELASMVLINTSLRAFSPLQHRLLPSNYPALVRLALGRPTAKAAEREVFRMTCNVAEGCDATIDRWAQIRAQRPVGAGNAWRQLMAAVRYRAPLRAPPVPILLLNSAQDRLVSSRCSQAIADAWGCPLLTHPSAGHDLPRDDPQWVALRVADWIASQQR